MFFNKILILLTGLALSRVRARECSDRDYSASTWNFVECVENNFNSFMSDDYDQLPASSQICHDLDKRKESCLAHLRPCANQDDIIKAQKVLVEQWSQNFELEQKCQQFFSRVEIFSRRNFDRDSTDYGGKCSQVLYFGNRLLYDRCKSRVRDVMKKKMLSHAGSKELLIKDVCRSIENLVKCGDKILPHCLEARNVDEINDAILYKMENLLDSLKSKSGYDSSACEVFAERRYIDEDLDMEEEYEEENVVSIRRKDTDNNVILVDVKDLGQRRLTSGSRRPQSVDSIVVATLLCSVFARFI